jgi:hypothetical protein
MRSNTNLILSCLDSTKALEHQAEIESAIYPAWLPSYTCEMRQQQSVTEQIHKVKYIFFIQMDFTSLTEFQL